MRFFSFFVHMQCFIVTASFALSFVLVAADAYAKSPCNVFDAVKKVVTDKDPVLEVTGIKEVKHSFHRMNSKDLLALKRGKTRHYFIDQHETVWVSDAAFPSEAKDLYIISDGALPEASYLAQESGELTWNKAQKTLGFESKYTTGLSQSELESISQKTAQELGLEPKKSSYKNVESKENSKNRILECTTLGKAKSSFMNYLTNNLISSTAVNVSTMYLVHGNSLFTNPETFRTAQADMLSSWSGIIVGSGMNWAIFQKSLSPAAQILARTASSFGIMKAQQEIFYKRLSSDDASDEEKERTKNILMFNNLWFWSRVPTSFLIDRYFVDRIPAEMTSACAQGLPVKIYYRPGFMRIVEKTGFTLLYYGLRNRVD